MANTEPLMQVMTDNLVQAIEVWRPDADGQRLHWAAGSYGGHEEALQARRDQAFGVGEGLAGAAWQQGGPAIGPAEENFGGLAADRLVAIPSITGGECRGVVTIACDGGDGRQGAFEVWRPNERGELARDESWYAGLERFGLVSGYVKFPRRAGLPGKVWSDRFPRVMGSLGTSADFVRAAGAKADGLSTALGVPFMRTARELDAVLLLLSATNSPIARVMEVWAPEPEPQPGGVQPLKIVSADYGSYVDLAPASRRRRLRPGEGLAGRVFEERAPWLTNDLLGVEFPIGKQLVEYGFEWGVGLPVFVGDDLRAVVTLLH